MIGKCCVLNVNGTIETVCTCCCNGLFVVFADSCARRYGLLHQYTLHYFLVDDTVEIREKHGKLP